MATTKELQKEIERLQKRLNSFSDQVFTLKNELKKFKTDVAADVKYLTGRVDGGND
jgi:chaperonin cofactor prefoldin